MSSTTTGGRARFSTGILAGELVLVEVLDVLVARASSVGALHAGATTADRMIPANAIAVSTEDDPTTASRLLRLALTGIRP